MFEGNALVIFFLKVVCYRFRYVLHALGVVTVLLLMEEFANERSKWLERCFSDGFEPTTVFHSLLLNFAVGRPEYELMVTDSSKLTSAASTKKSFFHDCLHLALCFSGLQITLVSMGYIQERIMTQVKYPIFRPISKSVTLQIN